LPERDADEPDGHVGILLTRRGPMLIALHAILTSEDQGPPRGLMVFGRLLSEEMLSTLRGQTEVNFQATAVGHNALRGWEREVLRNCAAGDDYFIREVGPDTLHVFAVVPDIAGNQALILRGELDRDIRRRGVSAARIAFVATLGAGLVMLLIVVVLLQGSVVVPLLRLANRIVQITRGGDWHARLNSKRTDELGVVATEFDRLLDRIQGDIQVREEAEAALRTSEARTRAIVDATADAIIVCDAKGVIESVNPAAEKMFGCGPGEMVGQSTRTFMAGTDDQVQEQLRAMASALKSGQIYRTDMTDRRKDGTTFPAYVSVSQVTVDEGRLFTCIASDMTEYQQLHRRILRAEHLAMIGEMGASIAHEIRNPLAGISGAVQVLAKSVDTEDSRHEVFKDVLAQVARVEETVNGLLMFARPWTPERCTCDLVEVAMDAARRAARGEDADRATFEWEMPDSLEVHADPELMLQVLTNVYRNAVQAMPEGGRIRVKGELLPDAARLEIVDEGEGISEEVVQQAFNPFFTTKTRGTGLGLSVCRQIMEPHGGSITIQNAESGGAKVILTVPRGES
ncbi:MAG: PAS domain S-box protein, partial [bacterium]|nr:PAS domain S-box protein [bacterium]